ncbi:MAG: thiamine pyrophosphate-binding protein [Thermoleophilia bacterium]
MKYAEVMVGWLKGMGYTHCFFVAGGNCMHLLEAVRSQMTCVPFVHEVAAGIAAEYFNEASDDEKAFVVVTAGPGLTNIVTAVAGAYLESRELLVLGGQVKTSDLATDGIRQRGIQEVDGLAVVAPICATATQVNTPISREQFEDLVLSGQRGRPGPVFLEICLDTQGAPVDPADLEGSGVAITPSRVIADPGDPAAAAAVLVQELKQAQRPVILLGGGVSRAAVAAALPALRALGVPLMTSWNAMDRLGTDEPLYFGRPNTWGQRSSNILLAQADLVIALGSRLGLQQTGFNWQAFAPSGRVVQVEIDPAELSKGHPRVEVPLQADANAVLPLLAISPPRDLSDWVGFCRRVRDAIPLDDPANETADGYLSPFRFVQDLGRQCTADDVVIPCSSGGAFTVMMQVFPQKEGQVVVTDKALASMGYGLSGSIGAALANPGCRTILVEGDGGFAQNLQELATVRVNNLPLKIFIFANDGYASIRMTQRNYFDGGYLGCDPTTGLGQPEWPLLFPAFGIPCLEVTEGWEDNPRFQELWNSNGPAAFIVPVDPEQTYFPKISSRVRADGGMESNPLHVMNPDLPPEIAEMVFIHLAGADRPEGEQA